ncbi:hypothetical protein BV509_20105 [Rhodovulum sulfidophilum]|uniref:Secreted protein n=1 Tax=Rhodovulum visakhapatnamense TaxID=364297 RepID=A0ABS1RE86_9RHOB|nr:hypothetical protein [Rhodovulum visakhapatnamense]MBL3571155.1 hypothetical protein [Rhodovulum visakhapatnamense]MBL3577590.1 hypothetical protein [Rhodovulum visakhapatnamense]OLS46425.1 hypothetical protein BV509_20105 [Rhodovulum sulfidophilum]
MSLSLPMPVLAAATALALATPGFSATLTDTAADVMFMGGDITAEATAPVFDGSSFSPLYAGIFGGVSGLWDPAFVLTVLTEDGAEALYGEADSYSFDGVDDLSFVFTATGSAADLFGGTVLAELHFDAPIPDPFGATADIYATARLTLSAQTAPAPVPLPATLPMLLAALALPGVALRRRAA